MQDFATWTNLAETTVLLPPTTDAADYKVRIFSLSGEMLFAGHPTLGSCAAWLRGGGKPKISGVVRQDCGIGVVDIDMSDRDLAFAAPPTHVEKLPAPQVADIAEALQIPFDNTINTAQLSNGPNWQVL